MDTSLIECLAQTIGVRFGGTPAEHAGARVIESEFRNLGLLTSLEWFSFLGWELEGQPELHITVPAEATLPCFALVYSPSLPQHGLECQLRSIGKTALLPGMECRKHALVDPRNGLQRAHVITRLDGPGAPMTLLDPARAVPSVLVGGNDAQELERLARECPDLRARLEVHASLRPGALSCNVIGTLPGVFYGCARDRSVLVTAHHDTQYNSPGAVDNASGVQVLLEVARRMADERPVRTVQFIAFGAEEYMMLGSKHRAQAWAEAGELEWIGAVVNVDMPGCNSPARVNIASDTADLQVLVARVFERYGLFDRFPDISWQLPPWPTSDHAPFADAGLPTLYISHRGLEYPHLHLPTDTVDRVDWDVLELSSVVTHALVSELAGIR